MFMTICRKSNFKFGTMYINFYISIKAKYFFHLPLILLAIIFQQYITNCQILCPFSFSVFVSLVDSGEIPSSSFCKTLSNVLYMSPSPLWWNIWFTTVSDLEWIINSTTAVNAPSDSTFKEWFWVFNNPFKIVAADLLCHSQTPPIWEAPCGLLCHTIQSASFSC